MDNLEWNDRNLVLANSILETNQGGWIVGLWTGISGCELCLRHLPNNFL